MNKKVIFFNEPGFPGSCGLRYGTTGQELLACEDSFYRECCILLLNGRTKKFLVITCDDTHLSLVIL